MPASTSEDRIALLKAARLAAWGCFADLTFSRDIPDTFRCNLSMSDKGSALLPRSSSRTFWNLTISFHLGEGF